MEIVEEKRNSLSILALFFGIALIFIGIMELILILIEATFEDVSILFFTSPGDAVFETSFLDHIMKAFVSFVVGGVFLYGYPKIREGSLEGFSFLVGGGILLMGIGFLFIAIWTANLIDTAILGLVEPDIWEQYVITDGIRIEWFLAIGSINIILIWKKREEYLK
jgi:hypothetical protein